MQISPIQLRDSQQAGKLWIAIDGNVYDVSYWCKSHPGGKLVLLHSAGRDVSEAFHAYHPQWVRNRLLSYQIGQLACPTRHHNNHQTMQQQSASPCQAAPHQQQEDPVSMSHRPLPSESLHPQKQHQASPQLSQPPLQNVLCSKQRLKAVQQTLEANGLFQTSAAFYMKLAASCGICLVSAVWCVLHQHIVVGALLLGLFWQQVAFIGHDAGHNAVTHNSKYDGYIGLSVNACIGIGPSWWKVGFRACLVCHCLQPGTWASCKSKNKLATGANRNLLTNLQGHA